MEQVNALWPVGVLVLVHSFVVHTAGQVSFELDTLEGVNRMKNGTFARQSYVVDPW